MRNKNAYWLVLLLVFFSCREETRVNMVSGTLFQDCETRLANTEVALKANIGVDFGDPIILGTATTNSAGQFNFTYELEEDDEGSADLLLIKTKSFETLLSNMKLNIDQRLVIFRENKATVVISLSGSKAFTSTDTLYYGLSRNELEAFKVEPVNGVLDTFILSVPNLEAGNATEAILYYGVGTSDFQKAKEALSASDSSSQHVSLMLKGCNQPNEAEIVLN